MFIRERVPDKNLKKGGEFPPDQGNQGSWAGVWEWGWWGSLWTCAEEVAQELKGNQEFTVARGSRVIDQQLPHLLWGTNLPNLCPPTLILLFFASKTAPHNWAPTSATGFV